MQPILPNTLQTPTAPQPDNAASQEPPLRLEVQKLLAYDTTLHPASCALSRMPKREIRYLRWLLQEHRSVVEPVLHQLLEKQVTQYAASKRLLRDYPRHANVLIPLMAQLPRGQFEVLRAYVSSAPEWLWKAMPQLCNVQENDLHQLLDRLFGMVVTQPEQAHTIVQHFVSNSAYRESFGKEYLCEPSATLFLNAQAARQTMRMDEYEELLARNPFMRRAMREQPCFFSPSGQGPDGLPPLSAEYLRHLPTVQGLSRSTRHPEAQFSSQLLKEFTKRWTVLPLATFGLEYEMYVPGIGHLSPDKQQTLQTEFSEIPSLFKVVEDGSLRPDPSGITGGLEMVSTKLNTPEQMAKLQNILSRLNDLGAYSTIHSGVHIHVGIEQWTCESLGLRDQPYAWWWDCADEEGITRLQRQLIKQLIANFAYTQHAFFEVSRPSAFNLPIGHSDDANHLKHSEHWTQFLEALKQSDNLVSIASVVNSEDDDTLGLRGHYSISEMPREARYRAINTALAFHAHGTIEFRGFTKAFSDHMEVDPNLPMRDVVYLQDLMQRSLDQVKTLMRSTRQINGQLSVHPHPDMPTLTAHYVRDVQRLGLIHALGQRIPEQRQKTMDWFLTHQHQLHADVLEDIKSGKFKALLSPHDDAGYQFLRALRNPDGQVNQPHPNTRIRRNSLRASADLHAKSLKHPGILQSVKHAFKKKG